MKRFKVGGYLAIAGCITLVAGHSTRKSLGFGPRFDLSRYVTEPLVGTTSLASHRDPYDVARLFLRSHTDSDYYIRDDSYTDNKTGVTHIYVRQQINGLEVADGDININIYDGRVVSFGDSFFRGSLPTSFDSSPSAWHATYCENFLAELAIVGPQLALDHTYDAHDYLYDQHCNQPLAALRGVTAVKSVNSRYDPRRAALYFMVAAHPDSATVDALVRGFEETLNSMTTRYEDRTNGTDGAPVALISGVPGTLGPVKACTVYIQTPTESGEMELHATWRLEVKMAENWYEAYVSISDPSMIVSVADWTSDSPPPRPDGHLNSLEAKLATDARFDINVPGVYQVWRFGINDPSQGNRTLEVRPYDRLASPFGWHTISETNNPSPSPDPVGNHIDDDGATYLHFTTTWGNNVFAQENWEGREWWKSNYRPEGGEALNFTFEYGTKPRLRKEPKDYINAAVTQLFYTSNMVHDLYYRYGFDEPAGNFQQDNYGRGGRDNDAVIAFAQDGSGYNNANFMAPPDGQNGRCRMFLWNKATPYRDGDLESGIVVHELTHGLSARLTGGPRNSVCLGWGESAAMSEGWSDWFATVVRSSSNLTKDHFAIGKWASNMTGGIRKHVYSWDETVNALTYESLNKPKNRRTQIMGEVWAEILWVVLQKMVNIHGYSLTLFPPHPLGNGTMPVGDFYKQQTSGRALVPKHGNTLMIQLVIMGMKLQPCRASFFQARDAIIQADGILTGGENRCTLWAGFAKRGLGKDAKLEGGTPWGGGQHTNGFLIPEDCPVNDARPLYH